MRYILIPLFLFCCSLLYNCSNDVNLNADYKDITIVYGLLNPQQDTQFIKINKAFLPKGEVEEKAEQYSPHYYEDLEAYLIEYTSSAKEDTVNDYIPLRSIIKHNKEEGVFHHPKQKLYFTDYNITPGHYYQLVINTSDTAENVTAETPAIQNIKFIQPNNFVTFNCIDYTELQKVEWEPTEHAAAYQLQLDFIYTVEHSNGSRQEDTLSIPIFNRTNKEQLECRDDLCYRLEKGQFFSFIRQNQGKFNDAGKNYISCRVDYIVYAGSKEMNKYIKANKAQGRGLSQSQATSNYTNVNNGRGIFASRTAQTIDSTYLNAESVDTLAHGSLSNSTNFIDDYCSGQAEANCR